MIRLVYIVAWSFACGAIAQSPVVVGFERLYEVDQAATAMQGRVLIGELGCASCHEIPSVPAAGHKQAPNLDNAGARITPQYLRTFLTTPHETKPGTTMPDLFAGMDEATRMDTIDALIHFLANRGGPIARDADPEEDVVAAGDDLFHTVGCVACHAPRHPPRESGDAFDPFAMDTVEVVEPTIPSVPLPDFATKSNLASLTAFLQDPLVVRPSGRMPNMKLNDEEAHAIASYLLQTEREATSSDPFHVDPAQSGRGAELFERLGCAACHAPDESAPAGFVARPLDGTVANAGCLANAPSSDAPWYDLDARQREAIALALADDATTVDDALTERLAALNCYACHERDGIGGIEAGRRPYFTALVHADLGDEGRIPPPLTGAGAKLTPEGFHATLFGEETVRPYMATRMPLFGDGQVGDLPARFAEADATEAMPEIDVTGLLHHHRNHYGRQLMGTDGLSCISCHNLRGRKSLGIPAIDLETSPRRLRPEWFKAYLLDPAAFRPGTRMPAFFPEGTSTFPDLFKGNANAQIEALWIYLRELDQTRLPEGLERDDSFELVPTDKPILLRTFMKDVGPRAIAVGFTEGIHVAFDALTVRFALAWRGRFIDAESSWADRFSPFIEPLSEDRHRFVNPMPVAALVDDAAPWPDATGVAAGYAFEGYQLNEAGAPVFLNSFTPAGSDPVQIEEVVVPADDETLIRTFTFSGPREAPLFILAGAGRIAEAENGVFQLDDQFTVIPRVPATAIVRGQGAEQELVIVVPPSPEPTTVEMELKW
ncbi:MAG: cytochrome c [Candidatus Hydrogenedentes bacterium]|nr:cytochrome c [Candidatus Hydrogenedentota bacterium]